MMIFAIQPHKPAIGVYMCPLHPQPLWLWVPFLMHQILGVLLVNHVIYVRLSSCLK